MRSVQSQNDRIRGVFSAACVLGAAALLTGCEAGPEAHDPARTTTPSGVVLGADAEDPTARDKRRGVGRWREADETAGSRDPMHPDRRTHGFGAGEGS